MYICWKPGLQNHSRDRELGGGKGEGGDWYKYGLDISIRSICQHRLSRAEECYPINLNPRGLRYIALALTQRKLRIRTTLAYINRFPRVC